MSQEFFIMLDQEGMYFIHKMSKESPSIKASRGYWDSKDTTVYQPRVYSLIAHV